MLALLIRTAAEGARNSLDMEMDTFSSMARRIRVRNLTVTAWS